MNYSTIQRIFIALILFHVLSGCSTLKQNEIDKKLETGGNRIDCFSKKDQKKIIKDRFNHGDELTDFFIIRKNVVNDAKCIGLYDYIFTGLSSNEVVNKVLKFEGEIYIVDEQTLKKNEKKLDKFIKLYKSEFTDEELNMLILNFRKGTEYRGSFF